MWHSMPTMSLCSGSGAVMGLSWKDEGFHRRDAETQRKAENCWNRQGGLQLLPRESSSASLRLCGESRLARICDSAVLRLCVSAVKASCCRSSVRLRQRRRAVEAFEFGGDAEDEVLAQSGAD